MATEPPKPVSSKEIERLQLENEALRATNKQLREQVQRLAERQRELAREHAALEETFRRLRGRSPDKPGGQGA